MEYAAAVVKQSNNLEIIDVETHFSQPIMVDLNCWDNVLSTLNELKQKEKLAGKSKDRSPPPESLYLRKYQVELSLHAIAGLNTVICAPTGSGKTIVAVHLLWEHLKSNRTAKVVFLVPTVTLVEQQANLIRRYVSKDVKVHELTGGENNGGSTWTNFDVGVMTPQLLLNALEPTTLTNVRLDHFTLILFDECHHSSKKHPYNEIMKSYFNLKYDTLGRRCCLPQIVGLTASLGVGDAKKLSDALEYVINICANMDAQALSTVVQNVDELNSFVNLPTDILIEVPFSYETNEFSKRIIDLMIQLETNISPIFSLLETQNNKPKNCEYDPPDRKWTPEYTTWVYGWLHYAPTLITFEFAEALGISLSHLEVYHLSLDILAHLPMKFAFTYLFNNMVAKAELLRTDAEEAALSLFEEALNDLQIIASKHDDDNLISKLKEVLTKEYTENKESRTLVFVRTCEIAKLLEEYLNKDEDLKHLNAGRLTGVNTKRTDGGQTTSEQKEQMANFRNGLHKIMIATTVVEEGLDVQQCNLVIKYNHSTNEIGHMQRRGRGRAFKSKSILITHDPLVATRERKNITREGIMQQTLNLIHDKGQKWFASEIKLLCALQYDGDLTQSSSDDSSALLSFNHVRRSVPVNPFVLKCIKCDKHLLSSNDIRQVGTFFVCVDPLIWSRLCKRSLIAADYGSKIRCSCQHEFGTFMKCENAYLPVISVNGFVLYDPSKNYKINPRKWKDVTSTFAISADKIHRRDLKLIFDEFRKVCSEDEQASAVSILSSFMR